MKRLLKEYRLFWILSFLFLILGIGIEGYFSMPSTDLRAFNSVLHKKEKEVERTFKKFFDKSEDTAPSFYLKDENQNSSKTIYLVYEDKDLVYWSNNIIEISEVYESDLFIKPLIKLNDGYYAVYIEKDKNIRIVGLIPIYKQYIHQNNYLENGFAEDFKLVRKSTFSTKANGGHPIFNSKGEYLFSLILHSKLVFDIPSVYFITLLYLLGIISLSLAILIKLKRSSSNKKKFWIMLGVTTAIIVLRYVMLHYHLPTSVYSLKLFSPSLHASSFVFSSLGDYWLNAFFLLIWIHYWATFRYHKPSFVKEIYLANTLYFTIIFLSILGSIYIFDQIKSLVINSTFSLQLHTGSGITLYTIWAYAGASIFISVIIQLVSNILFNFRDIYSLKLFYKIWFSILTVFTIYFYFQAPEKVVYTLFLGVLGILMGTIRYKVDKEYLYSLLLLIPLVSAIFLTYIINMYGIEKEANIRSAKAESIIETNVPITRAILETVGERWNEDKTLLELLQNPIKNEYLIRNYLLNNYFTDYWSKYTVQVIICTAKDDVEFMEGNQAVSKNCFNVFSEMLASGKQIGNSPFYELPSFKGSTPYIGEISCKTNKYKKVRLFIRLDRKIRIDEGGFPELLLPQEQIDSYYERYSYARYIDNELRYYTGEFDYYNTFTPFEKNEKQTEKNYFIDKEGYTHYIYNVSDNYKIIVSEESLTLYKKYIAFPYIFLLLFFITLLIWLLERYPWRKFHFFFFRQQIKLTLISMLTLVFFLAGGVSLYYSYLSNQKRYSNEHNNKIRMLRRELFDRITHPRDLDVYFNTNLENQLKNYARIMGADINIYDIYGVLLSTSEPEIFENKLLSNRMNFDALYKLQDRKSSEINQRERIGGLEYESYYVTLWDENNNPIAYLNVPYFFKFKEFKAEMQDVTIAVLNINLVIIIIALMIAFAISQRLTKPLTILRQKFLQVRIGKKNEEILYTRNDEIKELVVAYNQMVKELDESTKLLAKSERESAWREMARQVAHEIKNPLTPMKLNLQFLQYKLANNSTDWKEHFNNTAKILLQQIDELSAIASAFSDFAKMPKPNFEKVELVTLLKDIISLQDKGPIKLSFHTHLEKAFIYADKNRIKRVFINLITNAIQSIPTEREGKIHIAIITNEDATYEIKITDNGRGIKKEIQNRIFTPNFTTKNSGMGLGLAITKDYISQVGGTISFETQEDVGTTFKVTLSIWQKK